MDFTISITDSNLVVTKNKFNTHFAIFLGSDGQEYYRPSGSKFVPVKGSPVEKSRREKTTARGAAHVYPHRSQDIPKHLQTV